MDFRRPPGTVELELPFHSITACRRDAFDSEAPSFFHSNRFEFLNPVASVGATRSSEVGPRAWSRL
jgi:hypothetical protein